MRRRGGHEHDAMFAASADSAEFCLLCLKGLKKSIEFSRLVDPALRSRPLGGRSLRAAVSEDHAGVCTTVRMSFTVFLGKLVMKVVR